MSCNDYNLKDDIDLFKKANEIVLDKGMTQDHKIVFNSLNQYSNKDQLLLDDLKDRYGLVSVNVYFIDGSSNDVGIVYKIKESPFSKARYLIYSDNQIKKKVLESYEQFVECSSKFEINANWTEVIINDCND